MENKKSIGLPGGPNEFLQDITQYISVEGYRYDSPDKNNSVNFIESGNISMSENDGSPLRKGPLLGIDDLGNKQIMMPGNNYQFPGDGVLEIPMAQRGYFIKPKSKVKTPEEEYYNPEVEEDITTGDWKQDFLYNNQWLMDVPLVGDYIKNKARKVAESSASERRSEYDVQIALDPDSTLNQSKNNRPRYSGWATTTDDYDNRDQTSLMDQYFSEEPLFPVSEYKPKSDYLEFLPSYSIKARVDEDRGGDQSYKDRRDQGLELTIRDAFKKFAGDDGTDNEYTFEDITKSKEFTEFLKNKKTIFMTNDLDEGSYLSDALGLDLGGHKTGVAWDEELNLPYVSISDAWDFSPDHYSDKWSGDEEERQLAKVQASLMHKAGNPFKIYDRFYFDPKSQDSKIKYYTDEEIEQIRSKNKNGGLLPKAQTGNFGGVNTNIKTTSGESAYDDVVYPDDPNYDAKYREAYNAGAFASMPNQLDEVVMYSGIDYEKYPYYDDLSAQQRKYFNDEGPIGRGARRAAMTKKGLAEDTLDIVNPLLYGITGAMLSPFVIASGIHGLSAAGVAASPLIESALAASLPGMSSIPGATVGNGLLAASATNYLLNDAQLLPEQIEKGEYLDAGLNLGVGMLNALPYMPKGTSSLVAQSLSKTSAPIVNAIKNSAIPIAPGWLSRGKYLNSPKNINFYHAGLKPTATIDDIDILKLASRQQKKGRDYAGFYMSPDLNKGSQALNYARQNPEKALHQIQLPKNSKVFKKEGSMERISQQEIKDLQRLGYDYIEGKNLFGQAEYILINKNKATLNKIEVPKAQDGKCTSCSESSRLKQNGGSIEDVSKTYMNYINGEDESEYAKNIYDKLNRMYYQDAKKLGMGVANYIATNVITNS